MTMHVVTDLTVIRVLLFLFTQYAVPNNMEKILALIISGHGLMYTM